MKNLLRKKSEQAFDVTCSRAIHAPFCRVVILSFFVVVFLISACFTFAQAEKATAGNETTSSQVKSTPSHTSDGQTVSNDTNHGFWKVLKVGFYPFAGYHDVDKLGHRSGFGYDYLHNLRRYTTWGFEYSDPAYKWPDMLSMLEEGKIDIVTNVQKSPEREKRVAFSKRPMGEIAMILTVKAGCTKYRQGDYKNWSGMRIGVVRESELNRLLEKFAVEKGFTFRPVYYDGSDRMQDDLQQDKVIDAIFTSDLRRLHNEWVYDEIGTIPTYIAVNKKDKALLEELDEAMLQLDTQSPDLRRNLRSKYFSEVYGDQIAYTPAEHAFIDECNAQGRTFTAILAPDRRPLCYFDDEKYYGILKEIADEIVKRTSLKIVFMPLSSSVDYQKAYSSSEVDIVFDNAYSFEQAENNHLVLSESYYTSPISILRRKASVGKLRSYAVVQPSYVNALMLNHIPADMAHPCKTQREAVELVTNGTCDAAFMCARQAEYAVYEDPNNCLTADYLPGKSLLYSVAVRDTVNPLLASIVNKAVVSIGDEFVNQVTMKYVANIDSPYTLPRLFRLYYEFIVGIPVAILLLVAAFALYYLRSRRKEYHTGLVFNSLPIRYFVIDSQGQILLHNIGVGSGLLVGQLRTLDDVAHEQVRQLMKDKTRKVIETGVPDIATYGFEPEETRSAMITRLPEGSFNRPAAIWISQDATELERTRNEARKHEEFCRLTLESIGDGVIATDVEGRVIMLNPVSEQMIGVKAADVIGRPHEEIFKVVNAYDNKPRVSPVTHCLKTGKIVELDNHTDLISLDGTRRYHVADSAAPIHDTRGNTIGAILVFRDVTDEYKRRSDMKNELAAWEAISAMGQIYRFRVDINTLRIDGSILSSDIWPIKDGVAELPEGWVHPEDIDSWRKQYMDICAGEISEAKFRYRTLKDGKIRYFRTFLRGNPERPDEITGLTQEITDFVREQNKQKTMYDLLMTCINTVPAIIYLKSANNNYRYQMCNNQFSEFFGRPIDKIIGYNDIEMLGEREDALAFQKSDRDVIETGKSLIFHEEVYDAQGQLHQFRATKLRVQDADGNPLLFGISLDVTEDYRLRTELQSLVKNWEIAADVARLATYRINYKTWELTGDKLLSEFWPTKDGKAVEARDWVYPEDVQLCEENYAAVIEGRLPQTAFVYRVIRDDGMHYYRIYLHKIPGHPDEITGLIHDITPFMEAQNQKEAVLNMWQSIVDSVPAIFYTKDSENGYSYLQCNRHVAELFNAPLNKVIGHTDDEFLLRTSDAKQIRENDARTMALGKPQKFMELLQDRDGNVRRFESTKIPVRDNEGRAVLIGMTLEVTELQELSEIRKIISSAFELLFSTDDQAAGVRSVLKCVCEFIGFSRAYVSCIDETANTASLYATYIPDGVKPMFNNYVFVVSEVRQSSWYESLTKAKRGDTFDCDFSKQEDREKATIHVPSLLSKYEEFGISGVHVNYITVGDKPWGSVGFITEHGPVKRLSGNELRMLEMIAHIIELAIFRKQMIEKLEVALNNAKAADKAKSFFLASMSHEIRTPLNAVIGFADILRDTPLDPITQREYLSNISLAGNSLLQLVNDILDLSKLEAGQVEFVQERTNMSDFMRHVSGLFSLSADQKNLRLVFDTEDMPDLCVDQQRLRQILFNLVGNAIKFTHVGSVKVTTKFEPDTQDKGTLFLTVTDTGVGVAKDDQNRLFMPFVQLTRMRGTNSVNNGTGLGLPIVKKMVTQLGGTISLESEPGKGTSFFLVFPEVPIANTDEPMNASTPVPLVEPSNDRQYRVLLVDDVPLNLKVLGSMLKRMHVTYKTAASGKEALGIMKTEVFDIILTDLVMPEMSGSEFAQMVRSIPAYAGVRIAAVTGERDKVTCDRNVFDRIMEKPISVDELYEYIFGTGR